MALEAGLLKRTTLSAAIDTTPILGRGAVRDTYNLVSDGKASRHGGDIVIRKASVLSKGVACLAVLAMLASGCAWAKDNKKTAIGGAGGATAGGLIAAAATSNPAAIAGAVILGGLVGGAIGNRLDQRDKELAMKRGQQSLNSGQPASWSNPDSGNSGTITPTRTYQESGTTCREYRHDVMIGDDKEQVTGTACRQADGTWKKK